MHLRYISLAKASSGGDNEGDNGGKSASDITAILGGSVQDVLLSVIQALGKPQTT